MTAAIRAWRVAWPALWIATVEAWFQGPLLGGRVPPSSAALPALLLVLGGLGALVRSRPRPPRHAVVLVGAVLAVAVAIRLPALRAPASVISSDSAVAGILAQDIDAGRLPAPVYAPGFPYEGTLKPHATVALSRVLGLTLPTAYAWTSALLHLAWTACVMALAWRLGGPPAAVPAGLFMALGPRFLLAFSVNNVGQYPEVNALGALALALLPAAGPLAGTGFVLGLALWQQLLAVYFVIVAAVAVLATPGLRQPRRVAAGLGALLLGAYPVWIWNAANHWATFELFRRGGKDPASRLGDLPDRLENTVTLSLPKLFGLTDLGTAGTAAALLGLLLPALVLALAWSRRAEIRAERGRSVAFLAAVLLLVVIGVFAVSKFSHRGARRPRYLLPAYTSCAIAFGWAVAGLWRRSPAAGGAAAALVLGANVAGSVPWLQGRSSAEDGDRAVVDLLVREGVRTGYAGFWVAAKFTFLGGGRFVLSGELGPQVSWVHEPHARRVRETGPDAYVVEEGRLSEALAIRLERLGCAHRRSDVSGLAVFHHLCRPVTLEEMAGYEEVLPPGRAPGVDPLDPRVETEG